MGVSERKSRYIISFLKQNLAWDPTSHTILASGFSIRNTEAGLPCCEQGWFMD